MHRTLRWRTTQADNATNPTQRSIQWPTDRQEKLRITGAGGGIGAACGRRFAGSLDHQLGKSSQTAGRTRIGA